jgi:hypothetical protein
MQYVLGNMLNGGGINPDGLSLDLQFAADKTLTARRGPTPVFTRGSTGTFVGSNGLIQSAAINEARFDHDPVTLACKGLLIEEGRTNLFSSTNLNDWLTARVTKTAITGIGLTNQATTLTIFETGSTYIYRSATLTTGVAYAISVRVKAGTAPSCSFGVFEDAKFSRGFNLSTNQWAASGGAAEFTNYTVTPNIDGWFLVSAIYTPTGATGLKSIGFIISGTLTETASFDTPQIEAGSFPTSYIPTTTGTLARSADVCSITGGNFTSFYNQPEGTVIVHGDSASGSGSRWCGTGPSNAVRAFELYGKTNLVYFESSGGTENSIGAITLPTKFGLACKLNDFQGVRNGTLGGADTNATMPSPTTFHIGSLLGSEVLNGCIISLRYYKKRLPNAKLVQLTV